MSQDLVELFRTGVLDLAWGLPPGDAPVLRQERGLTVVTSPGSNLDLFWMRKGPGGHPALRIKLVRQALAYGIDRATLVRQLLSVSDPRQRVVDSAVFATSSPYFEPNWRAYRYQPSRARRLLGRAGCTRGSDGIYSCSGQRLRLRFVTTGIAGGYRLRLLELVPAQLQQVGVEVVSTQTTAQAYFGQLLPSGAFDLALHSIPLGPIPLGKLFFGCGEPLNPTDYCQRLVTSDLDQAERILDATQRAHVLNRADARLARDVPALPFVQMPQSAAHGRHLRNFDLSVNAQLNFLWNAEDWWLDD